VYLRRDSARWCDHGVGRHRGTVVNLREGQGTTTVESKTNFFAATPVGTRLVAEATPLHRGRRTQVWETRLTNVEGRLVAKVTQTQMVL
jgi:1,4-dihydroxy-2-naphthoyl-CoA hydrolase